jgi:hypothetical protein
MMRSNADAVIFHYAEGIGVPSNCEMLASCLGRWEEERCPTSLS